MIVYDFFIEITMATFARSVFGREDYCQNAGIAMIDVENVWFSYMESSNFGHTNHVT
jgi:hypothetical protein